MSSEYGIIGDIWEWGVKYWDYIKVCLFLICSAILSGVFFKSAVFLIKRYFTNTADNIKELFHRMNEVEKDAVGMKKDIESNKDDIAELKSEHKENHK